MLCELASALDGSFLSLWLVINGLMMTSIFVSSSTAFYYYYWPTMVTFEKWQYKVIIIKKVTRTLSCNILSFPVQSGFPQP